MPLSPQEQAELDILLKAQQVESKSGLTPQEQAELQLLQKAEQQESIPTGGQGQAFIEGFGQGATLGHLPQLQAGAESLTDTILGYIPGTSAYESKKVDEELAAKGIKLDQPEDSYIAARDANIKRIEQQEREFPKTAFAGQLAGALATGIATGGSAAAGTKTAGLGARLAGAAKTGAAFGFLQNPGDIEGEISGVQLTERLKGMGEGAITGLVFQSGLEILKPISRAMRRAPDKIKNFAQLKALKAGGAMLKDFRRNLGLGKAKRLGQYMLDEGIVSMGDDIEAISKKALLKKQITGKAIGEIYKNADDVLARINPADLSQKQIQKLNSSQLRMETFANSMKKDLLKETSGAGKTRVAKKVTKVLDELADEGENITLEKLKELRESIDDMVSFGKKRAEMDKVQQKLLDVRNKLQDVAKQRIRVVDEIAGGNRLDDLVTANKDFSKLAEIEKVAKDKFAREQSNAAFGLRERISGGVGATVGAFVGGTPGAIVGSLTGTAITKASRKWGTPVVARTARRVADILKAGKVDRLGLYGEKILRAASESPEAYIKTIATLRNDPEFKRALNKGKK